MAKVLCRWSDYMVYDEIMVLEKIKTKKGFAKYFDHGRVDIGGTIKGFIIFEKLGDSILQELNTFPE